MVEEFDGEKRDENYEDVMFYKKMYGTCYPYLTMTSRQTVRHEYWTVWYGRAEIIYF